MNIIDPSVRGECSSSEALKCTRIALLCLQEEADHRPTMSAVNLMLSSNSVSLPSPSPPAFFTGENRGNGARMITTPDSWQGNFMAEDERSNQKTRSLNKVSMSELYPR